MHSVLTLNNAASIRDLRRIAKRRLPRFAFDFIDGGAEDERNLARNRAALRAIELMPRYLRGNADPDTETTLFGQTYSNPLGIAPMGLMNMAWPGADTALAKLAATANLAMIIATPASTRLETLAETANGNAWFQVFPSTDPTAQTNLMTRARAAGIHVLVVTIDVVRPGKRDRDIRNRLNIPFRPTPAMLADLALHPRWCWHTLRAGAPHLANVQDAGNDDTPQSFADSQRALTSQHANWDTLRRLRDQWPGPMIVKGILHPADAELAIKSGADAILLSNHGGRQIDAGPGAITALPAIAAAAGPDVPVLFDSGIRRGADAIRAKALGATMVFAGRAFAYGVAAGSDRGARAAFDILSGELSTALAQLGIAAFRDIDRDVLVAHP